MAEALRQAGRARPASVVPSPGPRSISGNASGSGERVELAKHGSTAVTQFPSAARLRIESAEDGDRRWALLLLAVTLLLMLSVIATGWFLIGGDTTAESAGAARSAISGVESAPSP
jgi:hypothetical protein